MANLALSANVSLLVILSIYTTTGLPALIQRKPILIFRATRQDSAGARSSSAPPINP
jgi:hypothetical protein